MQRPRFLARLLPDFRTLYVSLDELECFQEDGSEADAFLRAMEYASGLLRERPRARQHVDRLMREAGLPADDALGQELCRAVVARVHFLQDVAPKVAATGRGTSD